MNCAESSTIILQQIQSILHQIEDEDYSRPLEVFNQSTLGQHFRHILEFYQAVVNASGSHLLDYSARLRDKAVELYTQDALDAFEKLENGLQQLDDDEVIEVITDFHTREDIERPKVGSTIGRELMYAYDHAVHHLAIIKIGVKTHCPKVNLDINVGVAPSTIKYKASQLHS